MKLTRKQKINLFHALNWLLMDTKVDNNMNIFKYKCNCNFEERDFLSLKDLRTQLSNDIFGK